MPCFACHMTPNIFKTHGYTLFKLFIEEILFMTNEKCYF